jgi:hypothetical protein
MAEDAAAGAGLNLQVEFLDSMDNALNQWQKMLVQEYLGWI